MRKFLTMLFAFILSVAVPAAAHAESGGPDFKELPFIFSSGEMTGTMGGFGVGPFKLNAADSYVLTFSWIGDGDIFNMVITGEDGYEEEYQLKNGEGLAVKAPKDGMYNFSSPTDSRAGSVYGFKMAFHLAGDSIPKPEAAPGDTLTDGQKTENLEYAAFVLSNEAKSFEAVDEKVFADAKEDILKKIPELSDTGFYYELCRLAALANDAHTVVGMDGSSNVKENYLPFTFIQLDGKWYLGETTAGKYGRYLSNELTHINGTGIFLPRRNGTSATKINTDLKRFSRKC